MPRAFPLPPCNPAGSVSLPGLFPCRVFFPAGFSSLPGYASTRHPLPEQGAFPALPVIVNQFIDLLPLAAELPGQTIPAEKLLCGPVNQLSVNGPVVIPEGAAAGLAMLKIRHGYRRTTLARSTMQSWESSWVANRSVKVPTVWWAWQSYSSSPRPEA